MIAVDLKNIYKNYFGKDFSVGEKQEPEHTTSLGTPIKEQLLGREVFLPITFKCNGKELKIPCATIRVQGKKNIIKTVVAERKGTVKEQFSIGDYEFTIKGVLIGKGENLPDKDMLLLRDLFESTKPVELHNAIAEMFLDKSEYVCIESLEFPEVEGKTLRHRPFTLTCESDYVDSLTID